MSFPFQNCYNCGGTICGSDNYLQDNTRYFCTAKCADEFHQWEDDQMNDEDNEEMLFDEPIDFLDDVQADADALAGMGWGTDEDYNGWDYDGMDYDFGMYDN